MPSIYLRPIGLFAAPEHTAHDDTALRAFAGLPLSNTGRAFAAVEIAERSGRHARRRLMELSDVFQRDWPQALDLGAIVERLTEPRARFAGLALDRPRIMGIVNVTPDRDRKSVV